MGSEQKTFLDFLIETFNWKKIILLFACNDPLTHVINWFMIAMLFGYLIIYIFPNLFIQNKYFPIVLSGLLIFWIIFRTVAIITHISIFGIYLSSGFLYRSWYAYGLLFICLGIVLKRYEVFLKKIPLSISVIVLCSSLLLGSLEYFCLV